MRILKGKKEMITKHRKLDVAIEIEKIKNFIKEYFAENASEGAPAIVGISGGKDSAVVAALCKEALGTDRVIGVLMPYGDQKDIDDSNAVCENLGIRRMIVDIKPSVDMLEKTLNYNTSFVVLKPSLSSMKARMRMVALFGISQSVEGRVANTCNLSEDWIGYFTAGGDGAGNFAPLANYLCSEVIDMAKYLELPEVVWTKAPSDGLCGMTDEESFGFTYDYLDSYLASGEVILESNDKEMINKLSGGDDVLDKKICEMHERAMFKLTDMPRCEL